MATLFPEQTIISIFSLNTDKSVVGRKETKHSLAENVTSVPLIIEHQFYVYTKLFAIFSQVFTTEPSLAFKIYLSHPKLEIWRQKKTIHFSN